MKYQVIFYEKENGNEPVKEFLDSLNVKMKAKMFRTISILAENGPKLREPYSKPLRDGIFELRAKVGSDISRVMYFFVVGQTIVLTNGFIKKTARTPEREIETAIRYKNDYLLRKGEKDDQIR